MRCWQDQVWRCASIGVGFLGLIFQRFGPTFQEFQVFGRTISESTVVLKRAVFKVEAALVRRWFVPLRFDAPSDFPASPRSLPLYTTIRFSKCS